MCRIINLSHQVFRRLSRSTSLGLGDVAVAVHLAGVVSPMRTDMGFPRLEFGIGVGGCDEVMCLGHRHVKMPGVGVRVVG